MLGVLLTARFDLTDNVTAQVKSEDNNYCNEEGHSRFAVIAKEVMPAVVNIKVERSFEYKYSSPFDKFFNNDPFLNDFFGGRKTQPKQKIKKQIQKAEGSGFIYSTDGYIMTNNHVVEKADKIVVRFSNGNEVDLLYKKGRELVGIEIKSASTFFHKQLKGLEKFKQLTEQCLETYLVYNGENRELSNQCKVLNFKDTANIFD
jgi:hypothetical protein